jgi:hypothetical protein
MTDDGSCTRVFVTSRLMSFEFRASRPDWVSPSLQMPIRGRDQMEVGIRSYGAHVFRAKTTKWERIMFSALDR